MSTAPTVNWPFTVPWIWILPLLFFNTMAPLWLKAEASIVVSGSAAAPWWNFIESPWKFR